VDAGTVNTLNDSYHLLVKAGEDSVRAAWRFGQCIDSFSDDYYMYQLADAMNLSVGTLYRYTRLYHAYQRPELAVAAARELETYNIDTIFRLHNDLHPVPHGRSLRGRRWQGKCHNCGSSDVGRIEVDKQGHPLVSDEELAELVNGPAVPEAQFRAEDVNGSLRLSWPGEAGLGQAGRGLSRQGRLGVAGPAEARLVVARQGLAWPGTHGSRGLARHGVGGEA
jgi:hypothetical protein